MPRKNSNYKKLTSFNERRLLSEFMELPMGEDLTKYREPLSMKDLIEKTWANWGIGDSKSPEQIISENWQKVVGRALSVKCAPENLNSSSGILFIKTSSGPVKQELSFSKKKILDKIKRLESCDFVTDLRFT
jgi:hypothetical protein